MRKFMIMLSSLMLIFILVGCGGGGGGSSGSSGSASVSTATFIDAGVVGLEFDTASQSGKTDLNGNFIYQEGESVTFHIGNLYLGSAKPQNGKVTPLDLIGTSDVHDPRIVRILQTLQSLDSDNNTSNGITIDPVIVETLKTQTRVDLSNNTTTDADVIGLIGAFKVDTSTAIAHFQQHMNDPSNNSQAYVPPTTGTSGSGTGGTSGTGTASNMGNSGNYTLIAWNDLGMHCVDGADYSIFSILPPYNNLHAHLISKTATSGKNITSGVTITYESVADTTGSINTTSIGKTNLWTYVLSLFGQSPTPNHGLNLSNPSISNPAPSLTPAALTYNSTLEWWEAEGIPALPYDDQGNKNYYPMVKVVAKDSSGAVIATTNAVLPVSDEMSCVTCHASNSVAAAKPAAGWVNDGVILKDWKRNILRLHDEKNPNAIATANMSGKYNKGTTLLANADAGQPILCAACHKSNALGTPLVAGIKPLTEALHSKHATVTDPTTNLSMDSSTNRDSCYKCHPGSATKCLRGVMGNAKTSTGANAIDCQSCHGKMSTVGKTGREGWLDQPNCQNCHDKTSASVNTFSRFTSVFASGTTVRTAVDTRFATTANTPASGKSLYRFSKGHGNLQCESCHGATHAEYPSSHANDNVQSMALQGHTGTIAECTTCHTTVPTTTTGGPHGMHTVGDGWISSHKNAAKLAGANKGAGTDACATCHGTDYKGTFLSKATKARSFTKVNKTFAAGEMVTCYKCHSGPSGD